MDTDSDDEDYMETPSSDQQFRTAAHDHEVGASGESMSESVLSLTNDMMRHPDLHDVGSITR